MQEIDTLDFESQSLPCEYPVGVKSVRMAASDPVAAAAPRVAAAFRRNQFPRKPTFSDLLTLSRLFTSSPTRL